MPAAPQPVIHEAHPNDLDQLASQPFVMVAAQNLKAGHLVLDPDLLTPLHSIDERLRAVRNSGDVWFRAFNHETRRFDEVHLHPRTVVPVRSDG